MCAIFGIIGPYDEKKALYALSKLQHRGRDHCGVLSLENIFFAHHRLSIKDRCTRSNQPLKHKEILLSFNGEIYNFRELKKILSSEFEFKTQSDTEVIIASYLKWGTDFVNHLRGMFAIALLDNQKLYLFRDRLGKKPLFFTHTKEQFVFASEIKALLPFLKNIQMCKDAFLSYLSFLAPTPPYTFFEGVYKLAAGEYLCFENNSYKLFRYYDILNNKNKIIKQKNEALLKIEQVLDEAISIRLDADIPIVSLLSGGIDSATINAYAIKHSLKMPTYTLGYKDFKKYDEQQKAKESAKYLGIENITLEINRDEFLDSIDAVLDALDEPLNDPAAIPLYLLFKKIKSDGFSVVMSGEGSDELFLGYRQYFEYIDIEQLKQLRNKNWLKRYFNANYSKTREWEYYKRVFNDSLLFRSSGECFSDLQKNSLLKEHIRDDSSLKYIQNYRQNFDNSCYQDETLWYSYIDLNIFQSEHFLTKLDRTSMAHTIESRTPFLDHKLVETIFSIDPKLRYKDGITKSLLKEIMHNKISPKILKAKKKGFSNPYIEYLFEAKKLKVIQQVNQETNLFRHKELKEFVEGASNGKFKHHIWGLYILSLWIKKYLL